MVCVACVSERVSECVHRLVKWRWSQKRVVKIDVDLCLLYLKTSRVLMCAQSNPSIVFAVVRLVSSESL